MRKYMYSVAVAAAAVIVVSQSVPVLAQDAAKTLEARQKFMKGFGGHNKVIAGFLKEGKGTAADVAKHAKEIATAAPKIPSLFPKGTSEEDGVGETRAKAVIWQKRSEFEAKAKNLEDLATKVAMVADSGDKAQIAAAFGEMGKNGCGGCHQTFRAPEKK